MLAAQLQEALAPACGDCYRWAYKYQDKHPGAVLVHGTAAHREGTKVAGRRFDHAWIEHKGKVLDWQVMKSKHAGMDEYRGNGYPPEVFKKEFRPREERRYRNHGEAMAGITAGVRAHGRMHFGPWHD